MKETVVFSWAGIISLLTWFFGGMDGALTLLIALAIIDYLSGLSVGFLEHNISSSVGFKGICRKCFMFSLVGIANLIDRHFLGGNTSMKIVVCLFYISNEGISIFENVHKLGLPVPAILSKYFSDIQEKNVRTQKKNISERKLNNGSQNIEKMCGKHCMQ